jgi:tetratricopeptide (TPR) repeat protein/TolB-like protein
VRQAAQPLAELSPDTPAFFGRIVMQCLERSPEQRYQRAADVHADLEARRNPADRGGAPQPSAPPAPRRLGRTAVAAAAGAVVVIAALVAAGPLVRRLTGGSDAAATRVQAGPVRVAVMPLEAAGDVDALAHIAAGVRESLAAKLFQVDGVVVSAAAAVDRAARKNSLEEIARDLGAAVLLTGSVQGAGDRIRVTVRLDAPAEGRTLLQAEVDGLARDLLTLQDQVFSRVAGALDLQLTDEELARTLSHPTENIDAYALYLKGRQAMRGEQDLKNVEAALGFYEQALAQDARFALAYAGIADSALRMYRDGKDAAWAARALSAAQQAQSLDDRLPEVHAALGAVYQATGKTAEAIVELSRAVQLSPNSDDAHRRLGRAYQSAGREAEALASYRKAIEVNPYHWVNHGAMGAALLRFGDMEGAVQAFQRLVELEPGNVNGYNDLGAALLQLGRHDAAVAAFTRALELQPTDDTYTNLGVAFAYAGRFGDAVGPFEKAAELAPQSELAAGNLGDGYRWNGEAEKAAAAYRKAVGLALGELRVNPRSAEKRGALALYHAKLGDFAQSRRDISDARAIDANDVNLMYAEAVIHALANRPIEALAALETAVKAGYPFTAAQSDPDLRSIRSDARFEALRAARQE